PPLRPNDSRHRRLSAHHAFDSARLRCGPRFPRQYHDPHRRSLRQPCRHRRPRALPPSRSPRNGNSAASRSRDDRMSLENPELLQRVNEKMSLAARQLRLPLSGRLWRGQSGNWSGAGAGSSIDFQDHRTYLPGDDPRYINWQAYARTGNYSMKLYREEVSPNIDIVLDASGSMFFDPAKRERSWELLYFCRESALQSGSAL